jgi:hypothetical protein
MLSHPHSLWGSSENRFEIGPMMEVCKPNCKPTTRHRPVSGNTSQHRWLRNAKQKHTLSYRAAHAGMRILELENRSTGNRTVVRIPPSPPASLLFLQRK